MENVSLLEKDFGKKKLDNSAVIVFDSNNQNLKGL